MPIAQAIFKLYDRTINVIMLVLVFMMLCVLLLSFYEVIVNMKDLLGDLLKGLGSDVDFRDLVGNVLDVFIVIELFSTFMDYVKTRRVRLSTLLDVTVVFALREMLLKLYDQKFSTPILLTLSAVILILVISRTLTTRYSPRSLGSKASKGSVEQGDESPGIR